LQAQEHGWVLFLTEGRIEEGDTLYAQGGIAAATGTVCYHRPGTYRYGSGPWRLQRTCQAID